jgi:tetratricopeptide (TPR) repeat protein
MRPRKAGASTRLAVCLALVLWLGLLGHHQTSLAFDDGSETVQRAHALMDQGRLQQERGETVAARASLTQAMTVIQGEGGGASLALAGALDALGSALLAAQETSAAVDAWRRAVTMVRSEAGVYDLRQYSLLEQLVDAQSMLERVEEAKSDLKYMERVSSNGRGATSTQHGIALAGIGQWYCRLGDPFEGRRRYRESLGVLELHTRTDPLLLEPLMGLTRCALYEFEAEAIAAIPEAAGRYRGPIVRSNRLDPESPGFRAKVLELMRAEGDSAMHRAARLAAHTTPDIRFVTLVRVGDWFLVKGYTRTAHGYYAQAAQIAKKEHLAPGNSLDVPVQVFYPLPPFALRSAPKSDADSPDSQRYVEVEFTVRADGRTANARIVDRGMGKILADDTLESIRVSRYRPRLEASKPVATEGVRFRQVFRETK